MKEEIEALAEKLYPIDMDEVFSQKTIDRNTGAQIGYLAGYNAANEWVSVDIEPKTANVIVSYPYGVGAAKYIGGKYFLTHDWAQEIPEVTHWMPLPTPPTT